MCLYPIPKFHKKPGTAVDVSKAYPISVNTYPFGIVCNGKCCRVAKTGNVLYPGFSYLSAPMPIPADHASDSL